MSISGIQMASDQRLMEIIKFIGCRLEAIGNGIESQGPGAHAGKSLVVESDELEDWDEGYLAALNDIVVFIQSMDSSAAA